MTAPVLPETQLTGTVDPLWGAGRRPAGCPVCKQVFLVPGSEDGPACPHCARGTLEVQPAWQREVQPELLAPFTVPPERLVTLMEEFTRGVWLRGDDFNARGLAQRARPIFWPMWLVDCTLRGAWKGETGFDYQVKSSQESFQGSSWQTREVVETRVRWEPRSGTIHRRYENLAVPAVTDHASLGRWAGPYHLEQAAAYDPSRASGAALRVPDIQPDSAWPAARDGLHRKAAGDCRKAAGAQHARDITFQAGTEELNWTQLYLPLYVTCYTADDGLPRMVYINGQTGQVGGLRLASQKKGWRLAAILAGIALALLVLGITLTAAAALVPPAAILGGLLVAAALLVGAAAIVPAVWPWQWNRNQR